MDYKNFYSEFGKLLYAVAKSDGVVSKKEVSALKQLVKNELVSDGNSTDEFGTNNGYYAEMEFDILNELDADPDFAFNSFVNYVDEHHRAFDDKLISVTLKIAQKMAHAHYGTNKHEKILLEKLQAKLLDLKPA